MSPRELKILSRNLAKANPPSVLHRYRRATDWTLKELTALEVHVAGVDDMNDPFEYRAPLHVDMEKLRAGLMEYARNELGTTAAAAAAEAVTPGDVELQYLRERLESLRTASGLICATSDPASNRMWAYYGDSHRGVCIGYSTAFFPFRIARAVRYADPDPDAPLDLFDTLKIDPSLLSDNVSCRKGAEWAFEKEYRIPVGPFPNGHTRLLPIPAQAIVEVRLGAKIAPDFKDKVVAVVKAKLPHARLIQMGCDHQTFRIVETNV